MRITIPARSAPRRFTWARLPWHVTTRHANTFCRPPGKKTTTWPGVASDWQNSTASPACSIRFGTPAATRWRSRRLARRRLELGFVVETERQVEAHLEEHLRTLPAEDLRSRAILRVMKDDEARHADQAQAAGARALPSPLPRLMSLSSAIMKAIAYRI